MRLFPSWIRRVKIVLEVGAAHNRADCVCSVEVRSAQELLELNAAAAPSLLEYYSSRYKESASKQGYKTLPNVYLHVSQ